MVLKHIMLHFDLLIYFWCSDVDIYYIYMAFFCTFIKYYSTSETSSTAQVPLFKWQKCFCSSGWPLLGFQLVGVSLSVLNVTDACLTTLIIVGVI